MKICKVLGNARPMFTQLLCFSLSGNFQSGNVGREGQGPKKMEGAVIYMILHEHAAVPACKQRAGDDHRGRVTSCFTPDEITPFDLYIQFFLIPSI